MKPCSLAPTPPAVLAAALAAVLLVAPSPAGASPRPDTPPPEPSGTFGEVSDVTLVEIPVQVVHEGRPVEGLDAEDFHVLDEGIPRPIESFEVIDLATAETVAGPGASAGEVSAPVAGSGRRHFLLLFDLAFSRPHDLDRAERAARRLLDGGLHPSDLVGVAFYSARRGAAMLVSFTTDRDQVRRVLDGLRVLLDGGGSYATATGPESGRRDPLGLTAGPFDAVLADLAEALGTLARQTAGIRGAKHLVLFSNGFDADLLEPKTEAGPRNADHAWWATGGGSWVLDGGGLKFLGDLDLPGAGRYEVRLLAGSLRSGAGAGPFTFHGHEVVPSAGTLSEATGEARFVILGYGLSASKLRLEARVTTPDGEPLEAARAAFLSRIEAEGDDPEVILASVDTAPLAPGRYALEVVLRDGDGEARGRATTPIRIQPRP